MPSTQELGVHSQNISVNSLRLERLYSEERQEDSTPPIGSSIRHEAEFLIKGLAGNQRPGMRMQA